MNVSFRVAAESDVDFLMWLRNTTMTEHIEGAGIEVTQAAQLERVRHYFDSALIVQLDGQDVGLFKVHKHADVWELVQIQMRPEFQGRGIGGELIGQLLMDAKAASVPVVLNVFKNNPAYRLYKSLGFITFEETATTYEMQWQAKEA